MKKRLLCGIAVLLCVCTVCFCLPSPYVIRNFNSAELPVQAEFSFSHTERKWDLEKEIARKKHYQEIYCGEVWLSGFVAVVKVSYSTNYQWRTPWDDSSDAQKLVELLSPNRVYNDIEYRKRLKESEKTGERINTEGLTWGYYGSVVATATIEKILVEPENSKFKEGDTIRINEPYMIWDQRTPHVVEWIFQRKWRYGVGVEGKYAIASVYGEDYVPLEAGGTYLVGGGIYSDSVAGNEHYKRGSAASWMPGYYDLADMSVGASFMYCLSDKTKQAGTPKSPEQLEADYAYIAEHFGY